MKAVQRDRFPVNDFIKDPNGVAALYLGKQEGKELRYMGKVGTGWSRTDSSQIRKQLETVVSPKLKLTEPIGKPKAPGLSLLRRHRVSGHHIREPPAGKLFQRSIEEVANSIGFFSCFGRPPILSLRSTQYRAENFT